MYLRQRGQYNESKGGDVSKLNLRLRGQHNETGGRDVSRISDEAIGSTMKTRAEIAVECLTKPNDKQCRGAEAGPRLIAG